MENRWLNCFSHLKEQYHNLGKGTGVSWKPGLDLNSLKLEECPFTGWTFCRFLHRFSSRHPQTNTFFCLGPTHQESVGGMKLQEKRTSARNTYLFYCYCRVWRAAHLVCGPENSYKHRSWGLKFHMWASLQTACKPFPSEFGSEILAVKPGQLTAGRSGTQWDSLSGFAFSAEPMCHLRNVRQVAAHWLAPVSAAKWNPEF